LGIARGVIALRILCHRFEDDEASIFWKLEEVRFGRSGEEENLYIREVLLDPLCEKEAATKMAEPKPVMAIQSQSAPRGC